MGYNRPSSLQELLSELTKRTTTMKTTITKTGKDCASSSDGTPKWDPSPNDHDHDEYRGPNCDVRAVSQFCDVLIWSLRRQWEAVNIMSAILLLVFFPLTICFEIFQI